MKLKKRQKVLSDLYWENCWKKFHNKIKKLGIKLPLGVKTYTEKDGYEIVRLNWNAFKFNAENLTYEYAGKFYTYELLKEWDYCLSITRLIKRKV